MIAAIDDIRQRTWDFGLTVVTVLLLATLGVQSFVGTLWVWLSIRSIPGWEQSPGYTDYVGAMNAIAAPQIVALVVVMGLCVPKRLFARRALLWVSVAMVAVGIVAGVMTGSLTDGLAIYLLLSAAIQLAVVVMTVAGVRGPSYLTEGRLTKTGSGLLHLGFIVFAIVVVALQKSPMMMPVFVLSALLVTVGTTLSFYAWRIAWHRADVEPEVEIDWSGQPDAALEEAEDSEELDGFGAAEPRTDDSEPPAGADDSPK